VRQRLGKKKESEERGTRSKTRVSTSIVRPAAMFKNKAKSHGTGDYTRADSAFVTTWNPPKQEERKGKW